MGIVRTSSLRLEGSLRSWERRQRVRTFYLEVRSKPLHLRCRTDSRVRCRWGTAREVYRSFRSQQKLLRNELSSYRDVSFLSMSEFTSDKGHALVTASRTDVSLLSPPGAPIPAIERIDKTSSVDTLDYEKELSRSLQVASSFVAPIKKGTATTR